MHNKYDTHEMLMAEKKKRDKLVKTRNSKEWLRMRFPLKAVYIVRDYEKDQNSRKKCAIASDLRLENVNELMLHWRRDNR